MSEKPSPYQLWQQADGSAARYIALMREHGYIIKRQVEDPAEPISKEEMLDLYVDAMLTKYQMTVLGGPEQEQAFNEGKKGGYLFETVNLETGLRSTGIACVRSHPGERSARCAFCRTRAHGFLCDFPTGGKCRKCQGTGKVLRSVSYKGTLREAAVCDGPKGCGGSGQATCSKRLCASCKRSKGGADYCPDHQPQVGLGPLPPARERGHWLTARYPGQCADCGERLLVGMRVLWFRVGHRVLCENCGEESPGGEE